MERLKGIPFIAKIIERAQARQAKTDAEQVARLDAYITSEATSLSESDYPKMRRKLLNHSVMDTSKDTRKKKRLLKRVERHEARQE